MLKIRELSENVKTDYTKALRVLVATNWHKHNKQDYANYVKTVVKISNALKEFTNDNYTIFIPNNRLSRIKSLSTTFYLYNSEVKAGYVILTSPGSSEPTVMLATKKDINRFNSTGSIFTGDSNITCSSIELERKLTKEIDQVVGYDAWKARNPEL